MYHPLLDALEVRSELDALPPPLEPESTVEQRQGIPLVSNKPDEFTLRGYLDVIRRQRWLILIVGALCALAAFGFSAIEKKTYSAAASLTVNDPNQDLALLGGQFSSLQTPLQLASIAAPQVRRPEVVADVKRAIGGTMTDSTLRNSVSVSVDPNSYVIDIQASSRSAQQAAVIANAFAHVDVALSTAAARAQYRAQAAAVQRQLRHTSPTSPQAVTTAETLARLQNLSTVATPLALTTAANAPGSPSSPKTARNVLAALLFGLLLGVAVGTAHDALDRRLRNSGDVSTVLDHPVIGRIRSQALGHAGSPAEAQNGVGPLESPDQESFRILRQNIWYLAAAESSAAVPESSRTMLVTSAMAEEGKSTVAACLAVATAEAGKRTLLVECDLRKPVLAKRFKISNAPGLTDYLTGNAGSQEILQPIGGIVERLNGSAPTISGGKRATSNLVCITAGTSVPRPAELLASDRFRMFLTEVSAAYDSVILDTAPLLPVADTLAILPNVSKAIVCVRLGRTTRDQARAARMALDRLPERPVGIVLTDVRQQDEGYYYGYYGASAEARA